MPERGADVDEAGEIREPRFDFLLREPVETALQTQQLDAALGRIERRLLERDADTEADVDGVAGDVEPCDLGPPRSREQQGAQHMDERRLSRAVRAEKAVDLTRLDVEVDAVDGVRVVEVPPESFGPHRRVRHGAPTY